MIRIMIAGHWRWPQYESAFARGLRENGVEVFAYDIGSAFDGVAGRLQQRIPFGGPAAHRMGDAVVTAAWEARADLVLFWRPTHALPNMLDGLRKLGIRSASYNNDDPFSPQLACDSRWRRRNSWRLYLKALSHFDYNFFYREVNCLEALARGARHAALLLPYFLPWQDRPITLTDQEKGKFDADVVFIGHFEDDGRDHHLLALAASGLKVRVWGDDTWGLSALNGSKAVPWPIVPALGDDYAKALSGARTCLAFLSKLNRDCYTRRSFEIPATGSLLLSERTEDLLRMFREDEEACFFSSQDELVEKARWLVRDDVARARIAGAGLRRVWADGHDVVSRARQFVDQLSPLVQREIGERK